MPVVTHDEETTAVVYEAMQGLFSDIMPVRKVGQTHIWFTPWDYLIRWWGLEEAMMDLVERPEMVNAAVERMVDAWMVELDQFEALNLLSLDCNNTRIGSGGFGYTWDMPGDRFDPARVMPHNMWGCSNAQIFSEVSPDMHWEFALRHDLRWLERWKLTYYGCCEPLEQLRARHQGNRRGLRLQLQAQPGDLHRRYLEPGKSARISQGCAGQGEGNVPRGDHHEGRVHGTLPAAEPLGLGARRNGSRAGIAPPQTAPFHS
jgi:hypothetical protein